MIRLHVNGRAVVLDVEPEMLLLRVLRERLGLRGAKHGCDGGTCIACTVHVDGRARRACTLAVGDVVAAEIVTVEGLAASEGLKSGERHAVEFAFADARVPPCFCEAGLKMAAAALLTANPAPSDAEIDAAMAGHCRCATYPLARRAVRSLAQRLNAW